MDSCNTKVFTKSCLASTRGCEPDETLRLDHPSYLPARSHLISTSEDGTLCVFRARVWAVLRSLKGHKGRVNSVSVHPSGKVALSVGKDRTLYMWDLMRGRRAASMKLGFGEPWTRKRFPKMLKIFVYRRRTCTVVDDWINANRPAPKKHQRLLNGEIPLSFLSIPVLLGLRNWQPYIHWSTRLVYTMSSLYRELMEKVKSSSSLLRTRKQPSTRPIPTFIPSCTQSHTWLDTRIGALRKRFNTFLLNKSCRVKAIDTISVALPSTRRDSTTILSSVSSNGTVNVYDLSLLPPPAPIAPSDIPEILPVVTYDSKGSRLTCVTLAEGEVDHVEQHSLEEVAKRKRESDSDGEEEEEEDNSDYVIWSSHTICASELLSRFFFESVSDELVGLFSFPFSPHQLYTTPIFFSFRPRFPRELSVPQRLRNARLQSGAVPSFREQVARTNPVPCFADAVKHPEIGKHIIVC